MKNKIKKIDPRINLKNKNRRKKKFDEQSLGIDSITNLNHSLKIDLRMNLKNKNSRTNSRQSKIDSKIKKKFKNK